MEIKYNEKLIAVYYEKDYLEALRNPQELDAIKENFENRHFLDKELFGFDLLFKESLEHYVLKRLTQDKSFIHSKEFDNYTKHLNDSIIFSINHGKYHNNAFLAHVDLNLLQEYPNLINHINVLNNQSRQAVDKIIEKIIKKQLLTQDELDYICDYFAFNRNYDDYEHELLINYIVNTLTQPYCQLNCSQYVLDAIIAFIPKFFKLDKTFDTGMIRFCTDDYIDNNTNGDSNNFKIRINRKIFKNTDFKQFNSIKTTHSNNIDFCLLMRVAFHELMHEYQDSLSYNYKFNDSGFMAICAKILRDNLDDYNENYYGYETEIDATQKSWLCCKHFYEHFIKDLDLKQYLIKRCYENSVGTHSVRNLANKVDIEHNIYPSDIYDIKYLTEIIKRNPSYIKKYPMLKTFYYLDGTINFNFLKLPNIRKTVIGRNYINYVLENYSEQIDKLLTSSTSEETTEIIKNIYMSSSLEASRIRRSKFNELRKITSNIDPNPYLGQTDYLKIRAIKLLKSSNTILSRSISLKKNLGILNPTAYIDTLNNRLELLESSLSHQKR